MLMTCLVAGIILGSPFVPALMAGLGAVHFVTTVTGAFIWWYCIKKYRPRALLKVSVFALVGFIISAIGMSLVLGGVWHNQLLLQTIAWCITLIGAIIKRKPKFKPTLELCGVSPGVHSVGDSAPNRNAEVGMSSEVSLCDPKLPERPESVLIRSSSWQKI